MSEVCARRQLQSMASMAEYRARCRRGILCSESGGFTYIRAEEEGTISRMAQCVRSLLSFFARLRSHQGA